MLIARRRGPPRRLSTPASALVLVAAAAAFAAPAHAGRPLQAEDAGVLDGGHCEVEAFTARERDGSDSARNRSVQIGCGVGARTQLALATARTRSGGESAWAVQWGGKTLLWTDAAAADPDNPAALALAYAVGWGRDTQGKWRHDASGLNLAHSRPLGNAPQAAWVLHANLGHAREEAGPVRRSTTWALALEHAGIGSFAPMAELFGDDRDGAWWNLGLRVAVLPERAHFDVSYGQKLGAGSQRLFTLGLKLAFGPP